MGIELDGLEVFEEGEGVRIVLPRHGAIVVRGATKADRIAEWFCWVVCFAAAVFFLVIGVVWGVRTVETVRAGEPGWLILAAGRIGFVGVIWVGMGLGFVGFLLYKRPFQTTIFVRARGISCRRNYGFFGVTRRVAMVGPRALVIVKWRGQTGEAGYCVLMSGQVTGFVHADRLSRDMARALAEVLQGQIVGRMGGEALPIVDASEVESVGSAGGNFWVEDLEATGRTIRRAPSAFKFASLRREVGFRILILYAMGAVTIYAVVELMEAVDPDFDVVPRRWGLLGASVVAVIAWLAFRGMRVSYRVSAEFVEKETRFLGVPWMRRMKRAEVAALNMSAIAGLSDAAGTLGIIWSDGHATALMGERNPLAVMELAHRLGAAAGLPLRIGGDEAGESAAASRPSACVLRVRSEGDGVVIERPREGWTWIYISIMVCLVLVLVLCNWFLCTAPEQPGASPWALIAIVSACNAVLIGFLLLTAWAATIHQRWEVTREDLRYQARSFLGRRERRWAREAFIGVRIRSPESAGIVRVFIDRRGARAIPIVCHETMEGVIYLGELLREALALPRAEKHETG